MEFEHEKREARRILEGIEDGSMDTSQSWSLIERADPTLVYFVFTWLRENYAHHRAADAVLGRILAILNAHPGAAAMLKEGEQDPLVEWFEGSHEYRNLSSDAFISIVVDKLES